MANWKLLNTQYDKRRMKPIAIFYNIKYGFTGHRLNDRRKSKTVTLIYNTKKYNPRYFGERSHLKYTLFQLKRMGKIVKK